MENLIVANARPNIQMKSNLRSACPVVTNVISALNMATIFNKHPVVCKSTHIQFNYKTLVVLYGHLGVIFGQPVYCNILTSFLKISFKRCSVAH